MMTTTMVRRSNSSELSKHVAHFRHCGLREHQLLWRSLLQSREYERKFCRDALVYDQGSIAGSRMRSILVERHRKIIEWVRDSQSSTLSVSKRDKRAVECFYQYLHAEFAEENRGALLGILQTNDTGFVDTFKENLKAAARWGGLSGKELELLLTHVDESSSIGPQFILPNQTVTLSDIERVYRASISFVETFEKKGRSEPESKGKMDEILDRLGIIFSEKIPREHPLDFFCEDSVMVNEKSS